MSARIVWTGLDELRAELRNLPADLADEASAIVVDAAEGAKTEIVAAYERHRRTGNLAAHVKVEKRDIGPYGAGVVVKSTARHAFLFEVGTQARHTSTGANRGISPAGGGKPPGQIFVPIAIRRRRSMYERLKALLVRHGAEVSGDV